MLRFSSYLILHYLNPNLTLSNLSFTLWYFTPTICFITLLSQVLKWTLPSLNLIRTIVPNSGQSKIKIEWQTVYGLTIIPYIILPRDVIVYLAVVFTTDRSKVLALFILFCSSLRGFYFVFGPIIVYG